MYSIKLLYLFITVKLIQNVFLWSVDAVNIIKVDVSHVKGYRLEIPQHTLMPDLNYNVLCQVFKYSDDEFIAQSSMQLQTLHRDVIVELNVDVLLVTVNKTFTIQAHTNVEYPHTDITITWECTFDGEPYAGWENDGNKTIRFPSGLPNLGEYTISVAASVLGLSTSQARARVISTATLLPVLQVEPILRVLNEGTFITLTAHVSDGYPECSIAWYFTHVDCASAGTISTVYSDGERGCLVHVDPPHDVNIIAYKEYLRSPIGLFYDNTVKHVGNKPNSRNINRTLIQANHGQRLSELYTYNSLEEYFLSELAGYTNDTASATITAELQAAAGRARLLAECECSLSYSCTTKGTVYADIHFKMNAKPAAGEVMVTPESGIALETMFRISTLANSDPDRPLKYSFFCKLESNETIMLGSYLEHLAIETVLPFIDGTTIVWAQICDSLGACTDGIPSGVQVLSGDARTIDLLIDNARAQAARCEMMALRQSAMFAVTTYTNARQIEALSNSTTALIEILGSLDEDCAARNRDQYSLMMTWLDIIETQVDYNILNNE